MREKYYRLIQSKGCRLDRFNLRVADLQLIFKSFWDLVAEPHVRMTAGLFWVGYPRVSVLTGSGLEMIFRATIFGFGAPKGSVLGLVFHP